MTLKEFNLLKIELYDGNNLIYAGTSNDVPEELKQRQIKIEGINDKTVKVKLV